MIDIRALRENPEQYKKAAKEKNFDVDIDKLLARDSELKPIKQQQEELQSERNSISKKIPKASPEEREALKARVSELKKDLDQKTDIVRTLDAQIKELLLLVPQPAQSDVPVGKDDSLNVELRTEGELPTFDFKPWDHIQLGEKHGIVDFARGVKIAGSRAYVLKGKGALLEQAVMRLAFDTLVERGFTPMSVPVLVTEQCMEGTGYFPVGRDQAYYIEKDSLALVGTSEVPICSFHSNEMLKVDDLPKRYMGQSSCFRREAGSYGKDTKGLYRVHQFQKIEQVVIAPADKEQSDKLHLELLANSEHIMKLLELPYRVVYVCTGDLGQGQVKKHDIEAWMPSRNSWGETHSCSTFYDFQARRLGIRYKDGEGKKHFAYTLNNTAVASPRILIPLLEIHQQKDGSIRIPVALRPYLSGNEFL